MQSETDDGVLQGTKGLQLSVLLRWPGYQSIAHRQWKMESLSIPETNTVWRPRMKEPFFDCFNLFYNNCCPECSLSKSRLPIAVSDWIWTLKCFRSHTNHCSQHHPKTAVSSKALVLIFWEQRKSLIINKRIALIMLMPGACFVSKNPLPLVLVVNIYPLYNVALVFIHFEDGTVEGNGQALGCLYGGDNRLGQGHKKKLPKSEPYLKNLDPGWWRSWAVPSFGCPEPGCVCTALLPPALFQQKAPEPEMHWDGIDPKKTTNHTLQSMKKRCLILQSWLMFLLNVSF